MKEKTMIYLEAEELKALREDARARRISLAELFRRLVRQYLETRQEAQTPDAKAYLKIVALGSSGLADVSELHDQHLGNALRREHAG